VEIRQLGPGDEDAIQAASSCFDNPVAPEWARRFLESPGHHIFIGYDDGVPAGFVTGIEMTHPDKGTEMFLYELSVDERFRRRGFGTELVAALAALARQHGCYGMWVLTEDENLAALATYRAAGGVIGSANRTAEWQFAPGKGASG